VSWKVHAHRKKIRNPLSKQWLSIPKETGLMREKCHPTNQSALTISILWVLISEAAINCSSSDRYTAKYQQSTFLGGVSSKSVQCCHKHSIRLLAASVGFLSRELGVDLLQDRYRGTVDAGSRVSGFRGGLFQNTTDISLLFGKGKS
jgi:hypothetical protein